MPGPIIIQDLPSRHAALNFQHHASALARIIEESNPRFAIGIFGGWGAGKTTLMDEIARQLTGDAVVKVEFSAWRYEREPNLIVPLLDVIREALVKWAESRPDRQQATSATVRTIGKAVKALLAGFAFKAGLPNAMEVSFEASKAIDTWDQQGLAAEETARSIYHASFTALAAAFRDFATDDANRRIVVFVDDLDRCLPAGAIEVLEAMKLFFDLPGFVFVVGLDQKVVEAAVDIRYSEFNASLSSEQAKIKGEEYIKKIFQVPFSLSPVYPGEMGTLVEAFLAEAGAPTAQADEIRQMVLPHLVYMAGGNPINPREVKRYINAYTITSTMRPDLYRKNVILALQTMNYRADWRALYQSLLSFRAFFIQALVKVQSGEPEALADLDDRLATVPPDFLRYVSLGGPAVELPQTEHDIQDYIYAGEVSKARGDPRLIDAVFKLAKVRRQIAELPRELALEHADTLGNIKTMLSSVKDSLSSHSMDSITSGNVQVELSKVLREVEVAHGKVKAGGERAIGSIDWKPSTDRIKALVPQLIGTY